ncbi:MAG: hypothetical protein AB7O28_02245 [Vicinamibacterales bacterium]
MPLRAVAFVALALCPVWSAPAGAVSLDTLRPQGELMQRWLQMAVATSATAAALADRIAGGDVIVYLDVRRDLPAGVAAHLTWMAATPTGRIVRVSIRPGQRRQDAVGFIAHELQHVVELIDHPDVRSAADLEALYARIGHRNDRTSRRWDTVAAIEAGEVARLEMLAAVDRPGDLAHLQGRNVAMPASGLRVMSGTRAPAAG